MLYCLSNHFGTVVLLSIYRALWVYQRWVLAEKYNLYQYLKWERKENREMKFSGGGPAWTKAQGPKIPNHFMLLYHKMEIRVAGDVIEGRQWPYPKRTRLWLIKEFGMFEIVLASDSLWWKMLESDLQRRRLGFGTRDQAWSLKSFCVADFY